jgi:hypothetical protein
MCVQVHFVFHHILNEIKQIYCGENGQTICEQWQVDMKKWIQ